MNDAVHQLLQVILRGLTWVMRTVETLWVWSWSQIASVFSISWGNLPGWKLAVEIAMIALAAILVVMFMRSLQAFGRIAGVDRHVLAQSERIELIHPREVAGLGAARIRDPFQLG